MRAATRVKCRSRLPHLALVQLTVQIVNVSIDVRIYTRAHTVFVLQPALKTPADGANVQRNSLTLSLALTRSLSRTPSLLTLSQALVACTEASEQAVRAEMTKLDGADVGGLADGSY